MAKGYSFRENPKPVNCTATPVAGGTLTNGVTYYYRVMGTYGPSNNYWYGKSKIGDEFTGTADATNKSMSISFDSPLGENVYYRIFRATVTDGQFGKGKMLTVQPSDATYNTAGTVTYVDDGISTYYGNYYLENDNDPHGRLTISGGTELDKFSIVDLYDESEAQGWGIIEKLDINTYKVNCHMVTSGENWWYDVTKTIIFADGFNGGSSFHCHFGETSGNQTKWGCRIVISSTWLSNCSWGKLIAYRTSFNYVFPSLESGLGLVSASFRSGLLQDCSIDKFRRFAPTGRLNCTFKNCIFSKFDNLFSVYTANFDGVKCLSGSRVWQSSGGGSTAIDARGVYTEGTSVILVVNSVAPAYISLVDSQFTGNKMIGNYAGNNGFKLYDNFSFNLKVYEYDEITPIENATVTMYDNTEEVFSVTTDANGDIAEQIVLREEGVSIYPSTGVYTDKSPFTLLITKSGKENYKEKFPVSASKAIVKIVAMANLGATTIYDSTLTDVVLY